MSSEQTIEVRLTAVETAIAELQQRLDSVAAPGNWIERITGSFKDEPAFEEVLELGRAFRASEFPAQPY